MKRIIRAATFAAVALAFLSPAVATAADEPITLPDEASFGALTISMSAAKAFGLSCNEIAAQLSCYLTQAEADAALADSPVVAASSCTPGMQLYDGTSFSGLTVTFTTLGSWFNLTGFNNVTSSWKAGCAAGKLADGTGGAGASVGLSAGVTQSSMGTFNNLASSARRCPC